MRNRGKFITIEGGEGAGKSTQAALLHEYFGRGGIPCLRTREPGGTPVAEKIRALILDRTNDIDGMTEAFLFCAARASHVQRVIKPALQKGMHVICDRFSDSTVAYQVYGRGLPYDDVVRIGEVAACGLVPDITFFLDVPPAQSFFRKNGADQSDRMESEKKDFYKRIYGGFCELAQRNAERIVRIDTILRNENDIHADIISVLKSRGIV
jgi:dTMP kinase